MSKLTKLLFGISLGLFALSYPVCQAGERSAKAEMAKYPAEFVEAHQFDMIFARFVLPGIWLFSSALLCGFIAVIVWITQRAKHRRTSPPPTR